MITYRVRLFSPDSGEKFNKEYKTQRNAWKRYVALRENLQKDEHVLYIRLENNEVVAMLEHCNGQEASS